MCESVREEKKNLRKQFLSLRRALFSSEKSRAVVQAFLSSPFIREESFFVYLSYGTEVDTRELVSALKAAHKRVCAPLITGEKMISAPLGGETEKNRYGILQPSGGEETTCAVAVAPLLALDGEGYRLGYGGGFYDGYFALHPAPLRVGLLFDGQRGTFPHDGRDVPLDAAVSENGVQFFTARARLFQARDGGR